MNNSTGGVFGTLVPGGMGDGNDQKAAQACATCKRQKRKCDKTIPQCGLCRRMNRACDYNHSNANHMSPESLLALQRRVDELESRQPYQAPPATMHSLMYSQPPSQPQPLLGYEAAWQNAKNEFPAMAFLDNQTFRAER